MQMLCPLVPEITVNADAGESVLDQARKAPPLSATASASRRTDSPWPTPTVPLDFAVFGY